MRRASHCRIDQPIRVSKRIKFYKLEFYKSWIRNKKEKIDDQN